MDIDIHNQILWRGCRIAAKRLEGKQPIVDPRVAFPMLVRGSWMNDTNQATLLLDQVNAKITVDDEQRRFFRKLWQLAQEKVLIELGGQLSPQLIQDARKRAENGNHADDFSAYEPLDHLDIERDDVASEYGGAEQRGSIAKTVHRATRLHVPSRVLSSTIGNDASDRLEPALLTSLGRGLHTVADFFSHTNYVELLLWSAARRGELTDDLKAILSAESAPFGAHADTRLRFALPSPGDFPVRNSFMWYGDAPEVTPLVSSLFDKRDTAHSLLEMYAAHLEREDIPPPSSDDIDLLLAVFQVPGQRIISAAWKLYEGARDVLLAIGSAVRNALIGILEAVVARQSTEVREIAEPVINLMKNYDSAEARDWARAGKFRYLVHTLGKEMASELANQSPTVQKLPHHSLLAKDHLPDDDAGRLRHRLACRLAAEVSADLIEWHFSRDPRDDLFDEVSRTCLIHPASQLAGHKPIVTGAALVQCLTELRGADWYGSPTTEVFKWRA